jgi:signal transduction histidine kinase
MYPEYAPAETAIKHEGLDESHTRLQGPWLVLVRLVWVVLSLLAWSIFIASLPVYFASQQKSYTVGYAVFLLVLGIFVSLVWFIVAVMIFWRKSNDWLALLVSLMLVLQGVNTTVNALQIIPSVWQVPASVLALVAFDLLFLVFCLFPNGRFVPRWVPWIGVLFLGWEVLLILNIFPQSYTLLTVLVQYSFLGSFVVAQLYRYHTVSSRTERQQTKWIVFGVTMTYLIELGFDFCFVLFPSYFSPGSLGVIILEPLGNVVPILIPLSFGFAILRYRLWDIDIIIQRTLVYGTLTAMLTLVYVGLVFALQLLLRGFINQTNDVALVVSTLVVAALFQPLRRRLQRIINRLMYGERDDPYAVLTRLGKRLEATLASDTVLPTIVETVAQTLKLAYVAITLAPDERRPTPEETSPSEDSFVPVATYGSPTAHPLRLPLIYQVETIGHLLIGPRPGETLTSANHRLLVDLARQIGISVHSVQLTAELQQARERLVLAREEERRRLRRDLHDGLGPQLASQTLTLTAARKLLRDDPDAAETLLVDATAHAQEAITDIRRLVYALRPPALDDLGLVAVLGEQAAQYGSSGVAIVLEAPEQLPPLPAAVEVACYRILQEALTNVVRHAHAHTCTIRLFVNESLCLEVIDDGDGLPTAYRAGVGLTSMRERAKELGGTCVIDRVTGGGTRVCAQLPLL